MSEVSPEGTSNQTLLPPEKERLPVPTNIRTDRRTPRLISAFLLCTWAITFVIGIFFMKNEPKRNSIPEKRRAPSHEDLKETPNLTLVQLKSHD